MRRVVPSDRICQDEARCDISQLTSHCSAWPRRQSDGRLGCYVVGPSVRLDLFVRQADTRWKRRMGDPMTLIRTRGWGAVGLVLIGPVAVVAVEAFRPGPAGHWSSHLSSAAVAGGVASVIVIGTIVARKRLPWTAVVSLAVVGAGLVAELAGNVRVAQSLWRTDVGDEEAANVGATLPGYEWGHSVAGWGDGLVILGALAFALTLGVSQIVGRVVAWVGGALALFPPWIYPALGPVLLLVWLIAIPPRGQQTTPRQRAVRASPRA